MNRDEWLTTFAGACGAPAPTREEAGALLHLAGIAAHSSERTAAPLACWMAGRAGVPLADLLAAAERISADGPHGSAAGAEEATPG
ncbi:MAG TPA: DUF6457 domain-containing protein [Solirubrobacteraceae bacterium]|nr:DUF6457 domain-containing protein [Solirubrobacteraceae bacterium]